MSRYKYVTVEAEVDLDEFGTDDLIEELDRRGVSLDSGRDPEAMTELLTTIWLKRREGKDYQKELDQYLYDVLGKVV